MVIYGILLHLFTVFCYIYLRYFVTLGQSDELDQKDQKLQNCLIFLICNFAEKLKMMKS